MNNEPLITARHICHAYGPKTVLNDISLELHANEIITLIGPNGAGKSTLLKILLNLIQPTSGTVNAKRDCVWASCHKKFNWMLPCP